MAEEEQEEQEDENKRIRPWERAHGQKEKNPLLQHLKLGKLKFGIRKIGCSMS